MKITTRRDRIEHLADALADEAREAGGDVLAQDIHLALQQAGCTPEEASVLEKSVRAELQARVIEGRK